MKQFDIDVVQTVAITLDESKFTPEFMEEFRKYFYDFNTVEEHAQHLAQLGARGLIETPCSIEGYGLSTGMDIKVSVDSVHIDPAIART